MTDNPIIQKLAELERNQLLNGSLIDLLKADGVIIVDSEGKVAAVSREAEALLGYTEKELLGKAIETLVPERFRAGHVHLRDAFMESQRIRPMGGANLNLYVRHKRGIDIPVDITLLPLGIAEKKFTAAALQERHEQPST